MKLLKSFQDRVDFDKVENTMPRVSIADTEKVFDVKDGDILYDSLYDQGEELPHGCLSGSCGACRIEVITGNENLQPAGVIETNTIDCLKEEFVQLHGKEFLEGKTIRLACRAKIKGDVSFRPLK
jgi:ferredoxin